MTSSPSVYVVILNYCSLGDSIACYTAVKASTYGNFSLLVVDNASPDGSGEGLARALGSAAVLRMTRNLGYAGGNNHAINLAINAGADYVLLLNPDVRISPNTIQHYVDVMEANPQAAALNSVQIRSEHGEIDEKFVRGIFSGAAVDIDAFLNEHAAMVMRVENLFGAALFLRSTTILQSGGFDPLYFAYGEETDLCRRWRMRGHDLLITNREPVIHRRTLEREGSVDDFRLYLRLKGHYLFLLKDPRRPFLSVVQLTFTSLLKVMVGRSQRGYPFEDYPIGRRHAMRALAWLVMNLFAIMDHRRRDLAGLHYADGIARHQH